MLLHPELEHKTAGRDVNKHHEAAAEIREAPCFAEQSADVRRMMVVRRG